ncbi:hypothetical protein T459_16160 [Capsicum annuum]|uniref:U-box domain-containing protein n=1 Tax=Capsicum annuum TaxID=4072 RepID=A0A2G2Z7X2_CAPAN|nr:hypothetical protein T459_16160 [Capsicum annuum]
MDAPTRTCWYALAGAIHSTTFLSAFVGIFQAAVCAHQKVESKDHKLVYWVAGALSGLSVLLEKKARRRELAFVQEDNKDELSRPNSSCLELAVENMEGTHVDSSLPPQVDKPMKMSVEEFDPSMQEGKTIDFMDLGFNTSNVPSLTCSTYSIESKEGAIPGFDEINSNAALPAVSNGMSSLLPAVSNGASVEHTVNEPAIDSVSEVKFDGNCVLDVMENPHIAADGYTYEGDAIKGWLYSGHDTSPMTNLKLDTCDLIPNYALYRTIQEWQQQS